jgi:hypothetical protein
MMEFNKREQRVLRHLFDGMTLTNGRSVTEEILEIHNSPYVQGIRPTANEWRSLCSKLHRICGEHEVVEMYNVIGGEG